MAASAATLDDLTKPPDALRIALSSVGDQRSRSPIKRYRKCAKPARPAHCRDPGGALGPGARTGAGSVLGKPACKCGKPRDGLRDEQSGHSGQSVRTGRIWENAALPEHNSLAAETNRPVQTGAGTGGRIEGSLQQTQAKVRGPYRRQFFGLCRNRTSSYAPATMSRPASGASLGAS